MKKQTLYSLATICVILLFSLTEVFAAELDTSFGADGRVNVQLGPYRDQAHAAVVQPDGKIVVAGSSSSSANLDFVLLRFNPDGSLDETFDYNGAAITAIGDQDDEVLALGLLSDGRIVAAGYTDNGSDRDFALARYLSDGSLDREFGENGVVVTSVGNSNDQATALVVGDDDTLVVAGAAEGTGGNVLVVAKFLVTGELDPAFADKGINLVGVGDEAVAESVVMGMDDRIVVSGSYVLEGDVGLMLVGFSAGGELDAEFGSDGVAVADRSAGASEGYGALVGEDGTILVAGSVEQTGNQDAALFKFTADGKISEDFGVNGILTTLAGEEDDVLYSLVPNGSMVDASGYTTVEGQKKFLVVRLSRSSQSTEYISEQYSFENEDKSLRIGKLQVEEEASYEDFSLEGEYGNPEVDVIITDFGTEEAISYGLAIQNDGKSIAVGKSGDEESSEIAVARYTENQAVAKSGTLEGQTSAYLLTKPANNVKRNSVFTGGEIKEAIGAVTQRGVVFSIAPDPVYKEDTSSTDTTTTTTTTAADEDTPTDSSFLSRDDGTVTEGFTNDGKGTDDYSSILENLRPGTIYYVRAYAIVDEVTYYGNQISFQTSDACFIATASFGSILHPGVQVLRNFRDRFMLSKKVGEFIVVTYYTYSPPIADFIRDNSILRFIVRLLLLPVIGFSWLSLQLGLLSSLMVVSGATITPFLVRRVLVRG